MGMMQASSKSRLGQLSLALRLRHISGKCMAPWTLLILISTLLTPVIAAEEAPKDVMEFLKRGELCEHFRQEPWPEGSSEAEIERRNFITQQIEKFCTGLTESGMSLRNKYRNNPSALKRLDDAKNRDE